MAAGRGKRRQAVRPADQRLIPAWVWVTIGLVLGLGLATFLTLSGVLPGGAPRRDLPRPVADKAEPRPDLGAEAAEAWRPKYDFYTVLPEMEVVIPEEEIQQRVASREAQTADRGPFVIQVGSFRDFGDADRIKAELALLGIIAHVKEVSIDQATWHRVRVGPFTDLRETDRIKRQLQSNRYDALVLSEKS